MLYGVLNTPLSINIADATMVTDSNECVRPS